MSSFVPRIAARYLWSKRSEAFITIITVIAVLGVAIGVAVLTMTMAIMTGFETALKEKVISTNAHVLVRHISNEVRDWQQIRKLIQTDSAVVSVDPFTYHQALVQTDRGSSGLLVRGIEVQGAAFDQLSGYTSENVRKAGTLLAPQLTPVTSPDGSEREVALPPIVIGAELQRQLSIFPGTPVMILSPKVGASPFGLVPRFRRFAVSAIYKSGLSQYEGGLAYVRLEDAQAFFDMGDVVSGFEVRVKDVDTSILVTHRLKNLLSQRAKGFYVTDWSEQNAPLWQAIQLEQRVYFLVLLLIVIMASFAIVTTLIMLVLEKRRDIAVLMTMGARSKDIALIFQVQGMTIGLIGTVAGVALGLFGCWLLDTYGFPLDERIFQMSQVPVSVDPAAVAITALCAFLICCVATVYPAYRASRIEPAEALRYG